jgi:3-hydroxybutyryl-CoA dehydratase
MFTKYFDDYKIGETWRSKGRTITEADIVNFASLSGDWYPLHTDIEYAKQTPFKQRIAHGMLVLSAASGLLLFEPGIVVAFYGIENLRFVKPTFIGDTLHVEMTVAGLEDKGNATGIVAARQEVKKQTDETVAVSIIKVLLNKK